MNSSVTSAVSKKIQFTVISRCFSCSAVVFGRRGRIVYDKRNYPTTDKDINEHVPNSNKQWNKKYAEQYRRDAHKYGLGPQPQGYYKPDGTLVKVPEMIPEFVVPDLTDCELKPYVPYNVEEITQSEFTAKDLFDATYGKHATELYSGGKLNAEDVEEAIKEYHDSSSSGKS